MAGELGEASQAISVGINGATVAMKGSKQLIEQMIKFIWYILKNTAFKDKENLKKLLSDPGKKTLCEFNDKDMKEVKSELNKLGVPYVILPDLNKEDGKFTVWVSEKDDTVLAAIKARFETTAYRDLNEYLAVHPEWNEALENQTEYLKNLPVVNVAKAIKENEGLSKAEIADKFFKGDKSNRLEDTLEMIKFNGIIKEESGKFIATENFTTALDNMRFNSDSSYALAKGRYLKEDDRFEAVSIKKSLILTEANLPNDFKNNEAAMKSFSARTETHIPYVLPNTKGEEFIWIPKDQVCAEIEKGEANEVFLKKNDGYVVYDKKTFKAKDRRLGTVLRSNNFKDKLYQNKAQAPFKDRGKHKPAHKLKSR